MKIFTCLKLAVILGIAFAVVGCVGEQVKVQSTEFGYEVNDSGISKREWTPGSYRLNFCSVGEACAGFLRLDVGKYTAEIEVDKVYLPKSNVDLVDVRAAFTMRVIDEGTARRKVLADVRSVPAPDGTASNERIITQESIAQVYVNRIIPETIIQTLKEYTVEQTLTEVVDIGRTVQSEVNKSLQANGSPVEITELVFPDGVGQVPDTVIKAKRALYAVAEEKQRQIEALTAEMAIEEKRQAFQRVRVANNKANAKDAGIPYHVYVALMAHERFADAYEAFASVAETFATNNVPFAFGAMVPPSPLTLNDAAEGNK
jgi:hypothetical protein